jgi:hypothetical protein
MHVRATWFSAICALTCGWRATASRAFSCAGSGNGKTDELVLAMLRDIRALDERPPRHALSHASDDGRPPPVTLPAGAPCFLSQF